MGVPSYLMAALKISPFLIAFVGVRVSSFFLRVKRVSVPFTVAVRTVSPARSRLKRLRPWVARAVMVAVPLRWLVSGA